MDPFRRRDGLEDATTGQPPIRGKLQEPTSGVSGQRKLETPDVVSCNVLETCCSQIMSEHKATITWRRSGEAADFLRGRYSREHTWKFDGGLTVPASPSPSVVPAPWSNAAHVDPEEALVASASSCHMLTFVWLAGKAGFQVDSYEDDSIGVMSKK